MRLERVSLSLWRLYFGPKRFRFNFNLHGLIWFLISLKSWWSSWCLLLKQRSQFESCNVVPLVWIPLIESLLNILNRERGSFFCILFNQNNASLIFIFLPENLPPFIGIGLVVTSLPIFDTFLALCQQEIKSLANTPRFGCLLLDFVQISDETLPPTDCCEIVDELFVLFMTFSAAHQRL